MSPSRIVRHLVDKAALSQSEIARLVGVTQPTISRLYSGQQKDCAFSTGAALLALYDRHTPRLERRPTPSAR